MWGYYIFDVTEHVIYLYNSYWYGGQYQDIQTAQGSWYGPVENDIARAEAPVYTRILDRSISTSQYVSRNSEGHMENVQPIISLLFILICNNSNFNTNRKIQWWFVSHVINFFRSSFLNICLQGEFLKYVGRFFQSLTVIGKKKKLW